MVSESQYPEFKKMILKEKEKQVQEKVREFWKLLELSKNQMLILNYKKIFGEGITEGEGKS